MYRSTYVEVNLDNIRKNVTTILDSYPEYEYYFGVVKGNCYGHGIDIIDTLIDSGINYLAVSSLEEGLEIRKRYQKIPILCLQPIDDEYLDVCSKNHIAITIPSIEYCYQLAETKKEVTVHIKIDSGMSRLGFNNAKELQESIAILEQNKKVCIEGIFTHMSTTGIADKYRIMQLKRFEEITSLIDLSMFKIIHVDKSATLLCQKKIPYCNGIRLGIILYGYAPSKIYRNFIENIKYEIKCALYKIPKTNYDNINLLPALSLYSKIIQVKKIQEGSLIGYGYGYIAKEDMDVATVEIGYADGLNLKYNQNDVWINGKRYPIIGTINMGMISIKVDETVKIGDQVELFGKNITAKEVAKKSSTSIYQLLTCISSLVPRIYKERKEK